MVQIDCFKDCNAKIETNAENIFKIIYANAGEQYYELKLKDMRTGIVIRVMDWYASKDGVVNVRTKTKYDKLCHILGIKVENETFFPDPEDLLGACVKGYTVQRDPFVGRDGMLHTACAVTSYGFPGDDNILKYGRKDQKLSNHLMGGANTEAVTLAQKV